METPNRHTLLARTEKLLNGDDPLGLRYAALELRMFMETVIYQKSDSFKKHIPEKQFKTWQVPKLLKILSKFDEFAEKDFGLSYALESSPGVPSESFKKMGEHKTFTVKWLNKNYNKIGGILHFPRVDDIWFSKESDLRVYLKYVLEECQKVAKGNILGSSLGTYINFNCMKCGQVNVAPKFVIQSGDVFNCLNENCSASFTAFEEKNGSWNVKRQWEKIKCMNDQCGVEIGIENSDLKQGNEFQCNECGTKYLLSLSYGKIPDKPD